MIMISQCVNYRTVVCVKQVHESSNIVMALKQVPLRDSVLYVYLTAIGTYCRKVWMKLLMQNDKRNTGDAIPC